MSCHTTEEIIDRFNEYILTQVGVSHDRFGTGGICPFSTSTVLDDKIEYVVTTDFSPSNVLTYIRDWLKYDIGTDVFIIIHPDSTKCTCLYLDVLCRYLNEEFYGVAECFAGHPESEVRFRGVLTRRDPFGNIQCNRAADLVAARQELRKAGYYDYQGFTRR